LQRKILNNFYKI